MHDIQAPQDFFRSRDLRADYKYFDSNLIFEQSIPQMQFLTRKKRGSKD